MRYGRLYGISFSGVAVSAAQDLWEVLMPADAIGILHRVIVTQESDAGDAEDEMLRVSIRRVTGAPTSGSGGTSATPRPFNQGDSAATITAEVNNTTQISGGTSVLLHNETFNVRNGLDIYFSPEDRPTFQMSTRCVIELDNAPNDELTMDGTLWVEQLN